jgi:hypothetical protein
LQSQPRCGKFKDYNIANLKKLPIVIILVTAIALFRCDESKSPIGPAIDQYASSVINFSSQYYTTGDWSAAQALGPENVYPDNGDIPEAWAPLTPNAQREHLTLGFETPQTVRIIYIYETHYPGNIDTVYLRKQDSNNWQTIYSRAAKPLGRDTARIFKIFLRETDYLVDAIRIAINSPADTVLAQHSSAWNEIDAVRISGFRKKD